MKNDGGEEGERDGGDLPIPTPFDVKCYLTRVILGLSSSERVKERRSESATDDQRRHCTLQHMEAMMRILTGGVYD